MAKKGKRAKEDHSYKFEVQAIELLKNDLELPPDFDPSAHDNFTYELKVSTKFKIKDSILEVVVDYKFGSVKNEIIHDFSLRHSYLVEGVTHENYLIVMAESRMRELIVLSVNHARGYHAAVIANSGMKSLYESLVS